MQNAGDAGGEVDESVMLCCASTFLLLLMLLFQVCLFESARAKLMHLRLLRLLNMLHTMHRGAGKFMCYLHECINLAGKWSWCILTSHKGGERKGNRTHLVRVCVFACFVEFRLNLSRSNSTLLHDTSSAGATVYESCFTNFCSACRH